MDLYKVKQNFSATATTFDSGSLVGTSQPVKSLSLPINMSFKNNGYSDLINQLVLEEKEKNVNTVVDKETIKFTSASGGTSQDTQLKIRFEISTGSGVGSTSWSSYGFDPSDISNKKNALTKSFFKLDFYDSNNNNTKNYLFSEFLGVNLNDTSEFDFNRIFWLKNDPKFIDEGTYRDLYFDATFFNAKDGSTIKFINYNAGNSQFFPNINTFKSNPSWRFAKFRVLNPYTEVNNLSSNNNRVFYVESINNNTDELIVFREAKIFP